MANLVEVDLKNPLYMQCNKCSPITHKQNNIKANETKTIRKYPLSPLHYDFP